MHNLESSQDSHIFFILSSYFFVKLFSNANTILFCWKRSQLKDKWISFMKKIASFFNNRSSTISFAKLLVEAVIGFPQLLVIFFTLSMTFSSSEFEVYTSLIINTDPSSITYNDSADCHSGTSSLISLNKWSPPIQKTVPVSLKQCLRDNYPRHRYFISNSPNKSFVLAFSLFKQKILLQI